MEAARLPLTQGRAALIDPDDAPYLVRHSWQWLPNDRGGYAVRSFRADDGRQITIYLHRYLLSARPGELVDHQDGDGLNNQRWNLRLCTPTQNGANRAAPRRDIPYRGVYRDRRRRTFFAAISIGHRTYRLGTFPTMEAAARAYDAAAWRAFGRFARLNFPGEQPLAIEQLRLPLGLADDVDELPAAPDLPIDWLEINYFRSAEPALVPVLADDWDRELL